MKIWGKKIKCLHCNTKFYDFKQKDTKCPKCSKSQVVKSNAYKKTDPKKPGSSNFMRNSACSASAGFASSCPDRSSRLLLSFL